MEDRPSYSALSVVLLIGFIAVLVLSCPLFCAGVFHAGWQDQPNIIHQELTTPEGDQLVIQYPSYRELHYHDQLIMTNGQGEVIANTLLAGRAAGYPSPTYQLHTKSGLIVLSAYEPGRVLFIMERASGRYWGAADLQGDNLEWAVKAFARAFPEGSPLKGPGAE